MSISLVLMGASVYFNSIRVAEMPALDLLLEVVPLIRTTCLGVIFPVNHAAINGMMVS